MSKPKRKRRKSAHGSGPATPGPEMILAELEARANEIDEGDPATTGPIWGAVHKLLLKTSIDHAEAGRIIARRDVATLRRLVDTLRRGDDPSEVTLEEKTPGPAAAPVADIAPEISKKAMRAFKKRLKLTRLDHESRLGVGPMTGGKKADFDAILPPREFGTEVWESLVAAGKLHAAGQGFYMLAEDEA